MAPATLYRFRLDVSDVDRGFYEPLDLRVPMHPSETEDFLITRVLAYALNYESGMEFSRGLSTPDEPAISLPGDRGGLALWIDIGNPLARRIHKASKAADRVRIYTYKDVANRRAQPRSVLQGNHSCFHRKTWLLFQAGCLTRCTRPRSPCCSVFLIASRRKSWVFSAKHADSFLQNSIEY